MSYGSSVGRTTGRVFSTPTPTESVEELNHVHPQKGSRGFMGSMCKVSLVSRRNHIRKKSATEVITMPPLPTSVHPQQAGDGHATLLLPPIELQPLTTDCRKPYFAVCTYQLWRCFRIIDHSLQQRPYFLLTSLKSDCPRLPIPQGPILSTAVRLAGPLRSGSQPYTLQPRCSSAKLARRSEDPRPDQPSTDWTQARPRDGVRICCQR